MPACVGPGYLDASLFASQTSVSGFCVSQAHSRHSLISPFGFALRAGRALECNANRDLGPKWGSWVTAHHMCGQRNNGPRSMGLPGTSAKKGANLRAIGVAETCET